MSAFGQKRTLEEPRHDGRGWLKRGMLTSRSNELLGEIARSNETFVDGQRLVDMIKPDVSRFLISLAFLAFASIAPGAERVAPEITADEWLNAEPISIRTLRGKVVLVEFWTFGCWNCKNVEPFVKQWHETYADQGLVILAVHSPEFRHERDIENVRKYVADNGISYPVPIDNDFSTWRDFDNIAWPAMYLIDKHGHIEYIHIGEGAYARTEAKIQELLAAPIDAT